MYVSRPMLSCACSDGKLITGQNPGSSKALAEAVIAAISAK